MNYEHPTLGQLLALPDVIAMTGLSKSTIYQKISESKFPKQKKLLTRKSVWLKTEVDTWIESQLTITPQ